MSELGLMDMYNFSFRNINDRVTRYPEILLMLFRE